MKKSSKIVLTVFLSMLIAILAAIIGYVLYVVIQYSRIDDNTIIPIENQQSAILEKGEKYTIATYNIGFGAYGPEYSFFMDKGVMCDGTKVSGKYGKSISKERTIENITGALETLKALNPDIALLQEVDLKSDRAWFVDQGQMVKDLFTEYSYNYISDFHTAYLLYPFHDPHGKTEAGLVTLSKYNIFETIRRSYPVPDGFSKFLDLDRCFSVHRLPVDNGKELVVINSHMSAYDEGGKVRREQLEMLSSTMVQEYEKGNYIIVGGDFNHVLGEDLVDIYHSWEETPDWIAVLEEDDIPKHFELARADNYKTTPTCRAADIPWEKGISYTAIVDGFIVSDNISYETENINTDFMYSDHQPVLITFKLK